MAYNKRYAARKIQRAFRKYRTRVGMGAAARKGRYVRRTVGLGNPSPTFVETFLRVDDAGAPAPVNVGNAGVGQVFGGRISDIPQYQQYSNLYKQYRINWMKVILVPEYNTLSSDVNASAYNQTVAGVSSGGMGRIVYAIQDSPNVAVPLSETVVLQDNGAKIKPLGAKWSCSFKPVPDVQQTTAVGSIYTRQKFKQWFNFDTSTTGNNPFHGAIQAYLTLPANAGLIVSFRVYYKVSFTLRDPQ